MKNSAPYRWLFGYDNFFKVDLDLSQAGWKEIGSHEVFTVTGLVAPFIIYRITSSLTSGGAATISFGHAGALTSYAGAQTYANLLAGLFVSPGATVAAFRTVSGIEEGGTAGGRCAYDGVDLGYNIAGAAMTGGVIEAYCWWNALSADGLIVPGAGGAL